MQFRQGTELSRSSWINLIEPVGESGGWPRRPPIDGKLQPAAIREVEMSRRQFGFLVGFLVAWLLWAAGFWVGLGAILLGLVGYAAARALEGDLDLGELTDRFTGPSSTTRR
jgi:hypothetical protein